MRITSLLQGALLGALTTLPLTALLFLGRQFAGFPFLPFDLFDWLARILPGGLVTFFVDGMVRVIRGLQLGQTSDVAKSIEQLLALAAVVVGGALFGVVIVFVLRRSTWSGRLVGLIGGSILFLLALAVEMGRGLLREPSPAVLWLALLVVGWGTLLGTWLDARIPRGVTDRAIEQYRAGRRAFLKKIAGGSLGLALLAWWLGRLLEQQQRATGANQPLAEPAPTAAPAVGAAPSSTPTPLAPEEQIAPAPGTRPAVTANDDFYRIDINLRPPVIGRASWVLDVSGLFDNPRPLTISDLMAYPALTQPITLSCISNPIGGDLIGNAYWTGLRLRDLLRDLGLRPMAQELYVEADDGFFESVAMGDLMDPRTLLVYGMNGMTLPLEHGYPLRILIPNRYGMKQPKWITRIEAIDREGPGYWVQRGWSKEAHPQILSIIDAVAKDQIVAGRIPVGGVAWAGDRGISKVEIQVDDGLWEPALLLSPLGPLTWVQWRYDWPPIAGRHTFRVRATDGTGMLQIAQPADPHPNGATGYHAVTVAI